MRLGENETVYARRLPCAGIVLLSGVHFLNDTKMKPGTLPRRIRRFISFDYCYSRLLRIVSGQESVFPESENVGSDAKLETFHFILLFVQFDLHLLKTVDTSQDVCYTADSLVIVDYAVNPHKNNQMYYLKN